MPLKTEEVHFFVLRKLGMDRIGVEVDSKDVDLNVDHALRKYSVYKPFLQTEILTTIAGVSAYKVDTGGMPIFAIYPRATGPLPGLIEPGSFDVFRWPIYEMLGGFNRFGNVAEIDLYYRWLESTSKILSSKFDWEWDEATGTIFVTPLPNGTIPFQVVFPRRYQLKEIPFTDEDLILDMALAATKMDLGRILRKFKEIPGSSFTIPTDGAELVEEGRDEWATAIKDLKARSTTPPFEIG